MSTCHASLNTSSWIEKRRKKNPLRSTQAQTWECVFKKGGTMTDIRGSAEGTHFLVNPRNLPWSRALLPFKFCLSAWVWMKEKSNFGLVPGDVARTSVISACSHSLFCYGCILCIPAAATPFDCRQAGGRDGRSEGMRKEQDTSLSVSLSDSANLVFKARAKLSLKQLKPRLVQQLCQFENKWPHARSSHELHLVILCFHLRNFGPNHYCGVSTQ